MQYASCTALTSEVLSPNCQGSSGSTQTHLHLVGLELTSAPHFLVGLETTLAPWESTANQGKRHGQSRHRITKELYLN